MEEEMIEGYRSEPGFNSLPRAVFLWATDPHAYLCKPFTRKEHEWRKPEGEYETYPVCIHCGKSCWWMDGYTLNSGTMLLPNYKAKKVMFEARRKNN